MKTNLKKYLSVSGSILAISNASNAAVIYTDVDPDLVVPGNTNAATDYYAIDLNNDAIDDFRIGMFNGSNISTNTAGGVLSYTWNGVWIEGLGGNGVASSYATYMSSTKHPFADGIDLGNLVGSSLTFETWGYLGLLSYWKYTIDSNASSDGRGIKGKFNGRGERYIGVRFDIGGNTHYGWIRVDVDQNSKGFTLLDYAYQDIPDSLITGGQMSAGQGVWSWSYDSYYGKQWSVDAPTTHTSVFLVPKAISGTSIYTVEVSKDKYFQSGVTTLTGTGPSVKQSDYYISGLNQGTTYWVRCKVDDEYWGDKVRSFTTHSFSTGAWTSDGWYGVDAGTHKTSLFVVPEIVDGVSEYTVEVNSKSDFTGTSYIRTGAGPIPNQSDFWFENFEYNKKHHIRVSTDSGVTWGPVESFWTHSIGESNMQYVLDGTYGQQYAINNPTPTKTSLFVVPRPLDDVSSYTVELCANSNFSDTTLQIKTVPGPTVNRNDYWFSGLQYSTQYYVRVKTDIDPYGRIFYFTTENVPVARYDNTTEDLLANSTTTYSAYPNPFNNEMVVEVNSDLQIPLSIQIIDLSGKLVYQSENQTNQVITIGSQLEKGIYLVQLKYGNEVKVIKVIKN